MDVCSKDFPQKSVNSRAGYTYNEILVTIVALGTLATLVIPYFNAYIIRAKQTIAKRELSTIYAAQKAFYSEYGTFHSNLQYIGYVPEGMTRYERNNWKGKNQHCINGSSLVENWAKESSPDDPNSSFGTPDKRYYSVGFNVNSGNAVVNRIRTLPFQCPIENSGHYYYGSTWPHVPRGGEFVATNTRFTVGATANLLSNFTSIKKSVRNFDGSINLSRMNLHDGMPIDVWTINELRQLRYKQVYYSAVLDDTTPITGSPEGIDPDTGSNGYPQGDSDSESENGDDDNENASNENNGEETNSDSEGEAEASYGSFQFSFQGLGNENTYGAYIDNVSLFNANYYSDDYDAQNCGENCYQNLITNGSFEEGHGLGNKGWNVYASIPGWTAITEISDAPIEIQNGNIGGLAAADGTAKLELDSHAKNGFTESNAVVAQTVEVEAEQEYVLTFNYAPRNSRTSNESNKFGLNINGNLVQEFSNSGSGWNQASFNLIATFNGNGYVDEDSGWVDTTATGSNGYPQGTFQLVFFALGNEDGTGAFLDNVSLIDSRFYDESYDPENCGDICYIDLIANGSFENGHGLTGKSWGLFDSIDDWFADTNTADAPIEVQTGNIAGLAANDGNAKLELDSAASNGYSQSNSAVAQIVDGFVDGQSYTLSFYHSARKKNSSTNQFGVSLNGTLLGEVFNDDKGWQQTTIEFVASLSNGYDANDPGNWDVTVDTGSNGYPQDGDGNLVVALEGDSNGYPSDGNGDVNSGGEGSGESGDNLYPQDTN